MKIIHKDINVKKIHVIMNIIIKMVYVYNMKLYLHV